MNILRNIKPRERIRRDLMAAIKSGKLLPGERIVSTRRLAQQYQTSHVNAFVALGQLVDQGYLVRKNRSGLLVAPGAPRTRCLIRLYAGYADFVTMLEPGIRRFCRSHPRVTVAVEAWPHTADLLALGAGNGARFMAQGLLRPLDELLRQHAVDPAAFHPAALCYSRAGNRTWSLPCTISPPALLFDRTLLDAPALRTLPSWTLDDLLAHVRRLDRRLAPNHIYAFKRGTHFSGQVLPFLTQFGATIVDPARSVATLDSPPCRAAFDYARKLYRAVSLPPADAKHPAKLGEGTLALRYASAAMYAPFRDNPRIGMAPMPAGRLPSRSAGIIGLAIGAECRYPDVVWELIAHLAGPDEQADLAARHILFPSRNAAIKALVARNRPVYQPIQEALGPVTADAGLLLSLDDLIFLDNALDGWLNHKNLDALLVQVNRLFENLFFSRGVYARDAGGAEA